MLKIHELINRLFGKKTVGEPDAEQIIRNAGSDNKFFKRFTFGMAAIAVAVTLAMGIFLIVEAAQLGNQNGVFKIFGLEWDITNE